MGRPRLGDACCCARLQVARDKLVHLGTSIGKLTHTGKFRLTVGCLDLLAQHAKYKVRASAVVLHHTWLCCGCQWH